MVARAATGPDDPTQVSVPAPIAIAHQHLPALVERPRQRVIGVGGVRSFIAALLLAAHAPTPPLGADDRGVVHLPCRGRRPCRRGGHRPPFRGGGRDADAGARRQRGGRRRGRDLRAAVTEISHFGLGGEVPIVLHLADRNDVVVINGQGPAQRRHRSKPSKRRDGSLRLGHPRERCRRWSTRSPSPSPSSARCPSERCSSPRLPSPMGFRGTSS